MSGPERVGEEAHREKRLVALSSALAAVALTAFKVAVGVATGSIGILSEAAHSGLDLLAAAVTFFAVRESGRPADDEHAYGHGKVENLSALFETGLLLVTCVWIVWEAVHRLLREEVHVEVTVWSFAVMAVSIVVDVSRSRALRKAAVKHQSQALEADALHFSTDVWSSAVVILGLGAVLLGQRLGLPWLAKADAVAALGVAAVSVLVSIQLGKRSVDELLDTAPPDLMEAVARAARIPAVSDVRQVRLRRSGGEVFADVVVAMPREASFERAHDTADAVERAVRAAVPKADVVVHVEPVAAQDEGLVTRVRLAAARHGLGAHAIRLHRDAGGAALDVHLEVDARLPMGEVELRVARFEAGLLASAPQLSAVHVHLEAVEDGADERPAEPAGEREQAQVREILIAIPGAPRPEELRVVRVEGALRISFRWSLSPGLSAAAAREQAVEAERRLRAALPQIGRVLIRLGTGEA
jgi:cation diffusion facilitator family transporter